MPSSDWREVRLPAGWQMEVVTETGSTNDEVRRRERNGEALVLLAERQLAGRGRRGSAWVSAPGESLTFSVRLRPVEPRALWPRLSLAAGLAVAEALEHLGLEAEVKWPNDVFVGGRKIAGILLEAGTEDVVIGIGLNVGTMDFPEGLSATSVVLESGGEVERVGLLSDLLTRLAWRCAQIGGDFWEVLNGVRERCALTGERVSMRTGEERIEGLVRGIGEGGELLVQTELEVRRVFQADEVRRSD